MPKLTPALANDVKKAAESSGFKAMDEGTYRARLTSVKATTARSSGNPMWVWEYEVIEEPYRGRKQWNNTVLTEAAMWKVAETFEAFEVPTDTDTDELLGCTVKLEVTQREITQGARKGQIGNDISRVLADDSPQAVKHRSAGQTSAGGGETAGGSASQPETVGTDRF